MKTTYIPRGVCSRSIDLEMSDDIITDVKFVDGCMGNLQAVARLVTGMNAKDAVSKLRGIRCGSKQTSCPDQLARAIDEMLSAKE